MRRNKQQLSIFDEIKDQRNKSVLMRHAPTSIYYSFNVAYIAVSLFCICDFITSKPALNATGVLGPYSILILTCVVTIALDVPLSYAGMKVKEANQRNALTEKNNGVLLHEYRLLATQDEARKILILSLVCCATVFTALTELRILHRDVLFSASITGGITDMAANLDASLDIRASRNQIVDALMIGFINVATTICSYVVSYASYDPVAIIDKRHELMKVSVQHNKLKLSRAKEESISSAKYTKRNIALNTDMYNVYQDEINGYEKRLKIEAKEQLCRHIGDPEEVLELDGASSFSSSKDDNTEFLSSKVNTQYGSLFDSDKDHDERQLA